VREGDDATLLNAALIVQRAWRQFKNASIAQAYMKANAPFDRNDCPLG
jgi:hypothetical protein